MENMGIHIHGKRIRLWLAALFLLGGLLQGSLAAAGELNTVWRYREGDSPQDAQGYYVWLQALQASDAGWSVYNYPHQPPLAGDNGGVVWLTTVLPAEAYSTPTLFFTTTEESFRVFLNDRLIYQYGDLSYRSSYGMKWHMVSLPAHYAGKHLTFQIYSRHPHRLGVFDRMSIDDSVSQMKRLFQYDAMYVVALPAAVIMFLIIGACYIAQPARRRLYVYIMMFFASFILWLAGACNTKLLFADYPAAWWYLLLLSVYTMPIFGNLIVYSVLEAGAKKYLRFVVGIYIILWCTAVGGELLGLGSMDYCLSVFYVVLTLLQLMVGVLVVRSAGQGNRYSQVLLFPLLGIPLLAVYDGVCAHFRLFSWVTHVTPLGIFTFIFFILRILMDTMRKEEQLSELTSDLETKIVNVTQQSEIDPLTKCFNRRRFESAMKQETQIAEVQKSRLTMLMLDIDFFKRINDTYGHATGDCVLLHFADIVRSHLDARHTFIRYGGEEFVVLCRGYDAVEGFHLAERIRQSVQFSAMLPGEIITCSIGVSQWHNGEDDQAHFYQRADQAMYAAKQHGRNRVMTEADSRE